MEWMFGGWYVMVGVGVYSQIREDNSASRSKAILLAVTWGIGFGMSLVEGYKPRN